MVMNGGAAGKIQRKDEDEEEIVGRMVDKGSTLYLLWDKVELASAQAMRGYHEATRSWGRCIERCQCGAKR